MPLPLKFITSKAELLLESSSKFLCSLPGTWPVSSGCTWVVRYALNCCSVVEDYAISAVEVASAPEGKLELGICRKVISDVVVKNGIPAGISNLRVTVRPSGLSVQLGFLAGSK